MNSVVEDLHGGFAMKFRVGFEQLSVDNVICEEHFKGEG